MKMLTNTLDILSWNKKEISDEINQVVHFFNNELGKIEDNIDSRSINLLTPEKIKSILHNYEEESPIKTKTAVDGICLNFVDKWKESEYLSDIFLNLETEQEENIDFIERKIKDAIKILKNVDENIYKFVLKFTTRIDIIKSSSVTIGSTSTGDLFGRVVLRNACDRNMTPLFIAESLLHESIHCYLNIVEFETPIFKSYENRIPVWSPWTNFEIEYHSLTHACFVWYSLFCFYQKIYVQNIFDNRQVRRNLLRTSCGFSYKAPVLRSLGKGENDMNKIYKNLIIKAEKYIEKKFFEMMVAFPKSTFRNRITMESFV